MQVRVRMCVHTFTPFSPSPRLICERVLLDDAATASALDNSEQRAVVVGHTTALDCFAQAIAVEQRVRVGCAVQYFHARPPRAREQDWVGERHVPVALIWRVDLGAWRTDVSIDPAAYGQELLPGLYHGATRIAKYGETPGGGTHGNIHAHTNAPTRAHTQTRMHTHACHMHSDTDTNTEKKRENERDKDREKARGRPR